MSFDRPYICEYRLNLDPVLVFWMGIFNPVVKEFNKVINPGPTPVEPGVIVTGYTGDPGLSIRQDWSVDGSFLIFSKRSQNSTSF